MGETQSADRNEATKDMIRVNERTGTGERPRETMHDENLRTVATIPVRGEEKEGIHFRWGRTSIQVQDTESEEL